jgi:hypothetical protein
MSIRWKQHVYTPYPITATIIISTIVGIIMIITQLGA